MTIEPDRLLWSESDVRLHMGTTSLDPWAWRWIPSDSPRSAVEVSATDAVAKVMGRKARRIPIGVIGPKEATEEEYATAESLGSGLARLGVQMLCGGRSGVMEAACKGNLQNGGSPIGLLPTEEWDSCNPYVAIPIATGIGPARNAIIARGCTVLIAVGGGYGTLSEIAYGLHFDRLVLTLGNAPFAAGTLPCADVDDALARMARHLLFETAQGLS
ncbi:TIGR00725 family protein [Cereibacter sp. SYSU M97828]|nr:TIGR00725 family protein [Cereibacter flavus]